MAEGVVGGGEWAEDKTDDYDYIEQFNGAPAR